MPCPTGESRNRFGHDDGPTVAVASLPTISAVSAFGLIAGWFWTQRKRLGAFPPSQEPVGKITESPHAPRIIRSPLDSSLGDAFELVDFFLEHLLNAMLGHEDRRDRDVEQPRRFRTRVPFERGQAEGMPGWGRDPLLDF